MYIREAYNPDTYLNYKEILLPKIKSLQGKGSDYKDRERREFLKDQGIRKIKLGRKTLRVEGTECSANQVSLVLERFQSQINSYLKKNKLNFERDVAQGKLEKSCIGTQQDLPYKSMIPIGQPEILQDQIFPHTLREIFGKDN